MTRFRYAFLVAASIGIFLVSEAAPLQQEPFEKREWPESHITLMVPHDWKTLVEKTDDDSVFHISPEPLDNSAGYQVGLAINILRSVPSVMGQKPSEYVQSLIQQIQERSEQEPVIRTTQSSTFKISRVEYSLPSDSENLNVINIMEANDATGTLYMIVWQAPESRAKSLADTREKIFTSIELDPKF